MVQKTKFPAWSYRNHWYC